MNASDATSTRGINEETFGMDFSSQGSFLSKERTPQPWGYSVPPALPHIGGVSPSRPTLTRLVSNEPSGSFFMQAITLAPAFSSDLSAGT